MKEKFSFIFIPDTQDVCTKFPDKYIRMMEKIIEYRDEWNVQNVMHLGDLVNVSEDQSQWANHVPVQELLNKSGIPYIITIGNHDYDKTVDNIRNTSTFNKYTNFYEGKPWVGGYYQPNRAENMYTFLEIAGIKFMFLSIEYGATDEVLEWANKLIEQYPDHFVIVITHSYLYSDGTWTKPGDRHNPKKNANIPNANDGNDYWHKCIKKHQNILAVFSGHHIPYHISYRFDYGDKGNIIFQSFQNWQCDPDGGAGRFRVLSFDLEKEVMELKTFNPDTDTFETNTGYELVIPFNSKTGIKECEMVSYSEVVI